jgi:predicted Kef-type K+ transport protein
MREVFAALLLVSVGAMFDPSSLSGQGFAVATAAAVVACARPVIAWLSARAVGYGREAARLLAIGAGQPGEFSLLVVALGAAAGLLTAEHRDGFLVALLMAATAWAVLLARAVPPTPQRA